MIEGQGTERDPEAALQWIEKAARSGYSQAQVVLGFYLNEGVSGQPEPEAAVAWLTLAQEAGEKAAGPLIQNASRTLSAAGRGRARQLADEFRKEIAGTTR